MHQTDRIAGRGHGSGGPHGIQHRTSLALADQVRLRALGAQACIVRGDEDPAVGHDALQSRQRTRAEGLRQIRGRTRRSIARGAVGPGDDRPRPVEGFRGGQHHGACHGRNVVIACGGAQYPPRRRIVRNLGFEGLAAQQGADPGGGKCQYQRKQGPGDVQPALQGIGPGRPGWRLVSGLVRKTVCGRRTAPPLPAAAHQARLALRRQSLEPRRRPPVRLQ